ncbi:DNA repair helicase [Halodesulfurarchaeum formicicum]|uniref:DNA 3'-5' helicase n=1 Tax=Halodesulfurarchaeum formicicum TaxID=1873524 RepID=A0A1D8S2K6_9EURY|nr:DEAD/DEAH box helicase [Halodesulfurarchaeum formicicum]AOW79563.1 DNA repair helicase [Halodesulfurarchaeum formicicum]
MTRSESAPPADPDAAIEAFRDAIEAVERPVVTATDVATALGYTQATAAELLDGLVEAGQVSSVAVDGDPVVFYAEQWADTTTRERVVPFPDRHEIVVDQPAQFTRAQLSQFARLADTNGQAGYRYEIRQADVWAAPHDTFESLRGTVRDVLGGPEPTLEDWIESQWQRARQFTLRTHEDGYTILEAQSDSLMGNVAREELGDTQLHGPIDDATSWVVEGAEAEIKRILYEAGYPVRDERELDTGDRLECSLSLELRDYQQDWRDRFLEAGAGVLVGPAGSGKTVAAMGILAELEAETLILVPTRELAGQWHEELRRHTDLDPADIGEYHGGEQSIRPVTIATYQIASMDRHRGLFDSRRWGLIVYDEAHRVPSPVHRLTADLQSRHRLGLTASPLREDDRERDIYTLIGPPIGTDWDTLFDAGYVEQPSVEIRYVPFEDAAKDEHAAASTHQKRMLAATNPAKIEAVRDTLAERPDAKALVFVEYLDQGDRLANALDVPFVSGETPHAERARLFQSFRRGDLDTLVVSRVADEGIDLPDAELAVIASGLGGSRRQGTQRAGRIMRPSGNASVVVLATEGSRESDFAVQQMHHLSSKGVPVTERTLGSD